MITKTSTLYNKMKVMKKKRKEKKSELFKDTKNQFKIANGIPLVFKIQNSNLIKPIFMDKYFSTSRSAQPDFVSLV